MYKRESYLFSCHEFWPEAARAKTLPHVKTTEATEPKYLPDPKNLRSSVTVLDAVCLTLSLEETPICLGCYPLSMAESWCAAAAAGTDKGVTVIPHFHHLLVGSKCCFSLSI